MILDHEAAVSCDAHPPYSPPPYDDDEYDVYLFWPSSYPHVLVPVEFDSHRVFEVAPPAVPHPTAVPNTCQLPPAYTDSDALSEDEIPDAPSFFRVRPFSLTLLAVTSLTPRPAVLTDILVLVRVRLP